MSLTPVKAGHTLRGAQVFITLAVALQLGRTTALAPSTALLAALLLVAGVYLSRATTPTLLGFATGVSVVPWTLVGIPGVPPQLARLPMSSIAIAGCLAIAVIRRSLRPPAAPGRLRLHDPALIITLATTFLLLSTVAAGSGVLSTSVPWLIGIALLMTLAGAARSGLVNPLRLLNALVLSQALVSTWDLLQSWSGMVPIPSMATRTTLVLENGKMISRFAGTLGDYELYSEINALLFSAAVALAILAHTRHHRVIFSVAAIPLGTAMLATGTRGGVVVAILALIGMCALARSRRWTFVLIGLAAPLAFFGPRIGALGRFASLNQEESLSRLLNRESAWNHFLEQTSGDLWTAFGHGLKYPYEAIGEFPHSLPFFLLYAGGVVGAALFLLALLWLAALVCRQALRTRQSAAVIMGPLLTAALVDQIKIEFVRLDSYVITVFTILAICTAICLAPASLSAPVRVNRFAPSSVRKLGAI